MGCISSSRGSSWLRDRTLVSYISCVGRRVLYHYCHLGSPSLQPHRPFLWFSANKILRPTASLIITTYSSLGNSKFPGEPHRGPQILTPFAPTLSVVQVRPSDDVCAWPGLQFGITTKFCGCSLSSHLSHPWRGQCSEKESGLLLDILFKNRILCVRVLRGEVFGSCTYRQGQVGMKGRAGGLGEPVSSVLSFEESCVGSLPLLPCW